MIAAEIAGGPMTVRGAHEDLARSSGAMTTAVLAWRGSRVRTEHTLHVILSGAMTGAAGTTTVAEMDDGGE